MIRFEDLYTGPFKGQPFLCTNEEPQLYRELLEERKFCRVASIASGGEIPLLVLLPRSVSVFMVDHTYEALASCWAKMGLLSLYGPAGMLRLLANETDVVNAIKSIECPDLIRPFLGNFCHGATDWGGNSTLGDARRFWEEVGEETLGLVARNLDKVVLVHGDFRDLLKFGQFDLFYGSNICEHTSRIHSRVLDTGCHYQEQIPDLQDQMCLVGAQGLLMNSRVTASLPRGLKEVGCRIGKLGWTYTLHQKES